MPRAADGKPFGDPLQKPDKNCLQKANRIVQKASPLLPSTYKIPLRNRSNALAKTAQSSRNGAEIDKHHEKEENDGKRQASHVYRIVVYVLCKVCKIKN